MCADVVSTGIVWLTWKSLLTVIDRAEFRPVVCLSNGES